MPENLSYLVIGHIMVDVIVQPHAPLAPTSDTPASVRFTRGGAGGNIAVAIAQHRVAVTYGGVSGDDWGARMAEENLRGHGVTPRFVKSDYATGTVVAVVGDDAQRAMLTDPGANATLRVPDVAEMFESVAPTHFHLSGYVLLDARTRPAGQYALSAAREMGIPTSVDACSVSPLELLGPDIFLTLADADSFFCNDEEAAALAGTLDVEEQRRVLATRFQNVVITCGSRGAVAHVDGRDWEVPAREVRAVDTTGAGDAATGTFLAARALGRSVDDALGEAMEASAVTIERLGATE